MSAAILRLSDLVVPTDTKISKTESGIIKVITKVRPDWLKEDIILIRKDGAAEDIVYGGYTTDKTEMVMVKVFRHEDRQWIDDVATIHTICSSLGLTSRIFASFSNGLSYETPLGSPLSYVLAVDRNVYPIVARRVGEMHRLLTEGHTFSQNRGVFPTLYRWLSEVPTSLPDARQNQRMKRELPSKQAIYRELEELESRLILQVPRTERNPVVYCHGDLSPSHIYFDSVTRQLSFVSLEFTGPNFQAFEIAHHFMTLSGGELKTVGREEFVPAREFQLRWCHNYLAGYRNVENHKVGLSDIERLYTAVQKFSLVFCLQEVIWSLVRAGTEIPGFDVLQYGIQRFQQYHRNKFSVLNGGGTAM